MTNSRIAKFLLLCFTLLSGMSHTLQAQDTTVVETLRFTDITKRRGWYVFPDNSKQYRKILMYYTLKCDPATTQDIYPCGEWDYTTYTNLFRYSNIGSPYYTLNGTYYDDIWYSTSPTYSFLQEQQYFTVYDVVTLENDYTVGGGILPIAEALQSDLSTARAQYLFTAGELSGAGLVAGSIDKLRVDITSLGTEMKHLQVYMQHTALDSIDPNNMADSLALAYDFNTTFAGTGIQDINLTTPFMWNGTSNLAVEFCFTGKQNGTGHTLNGTDAGIPAAVYSTENDGYFEFLDGDYIDVPVTGLGSISSQITVSCWAYGDPDLMPANTYLFEGRDAGNNRVINGHVPWSNSRVYWDCGNAGTGSYDRIDKLAANSEIEGQWNHWAFTKNAGTGEMKIFLNGNLWHSGTGLTRNMSAMTKFRIAAGATSTGTWNGKVNEFRIWNVALDQTTIQDWMYKNVDATHPSFANLVAYYKMDDAGSYKTTDDAGTADATLYGVPDLKFIDGCEHARNLEGDTKRPNITFVQGIYTTHLDTVIVLDSTMNSPVTIFESAHSINMAGSGITTTPIDTTYGWLSGYQYTVNDSGAILDSTYYNWDVHLTNLYTAEKVQLQNYVTPYGKNLDLGPNGYTWVYDVTDYEPVLHDTVDLSAGNQQELIDLKFIMIEGTPPRNVMDLDVIWDGQFNHSAIVNNTALPAVNFTLNPSAQQYMIRTRTSGHGFGSGENCAEFCPKWHHLKINGTKHFEWMNWKVCGNNPVQPQGGTWVYDRAGWCPGTFTDTYNHELTPLVTPGSTISIDYGMQNWSAPGTGEGNYRLAVQLFSYGSPNNSVDAELLEIVSPSEVSGKPVCLEPKIVIRNAGATTITSLTINYTVVGGTPLQMAWAGNLAFLESDTVVLDVQDTGFWNTTSVKNIFEVSLANPNGGTDSNAENDKMSTTFEPVPAYPGNLIVWFKTNNRVNENYWQIRNSAGAIVGSRIGAQANTTYKDTLSLFPECYSFEMFDTGDDGLSWWANTSQGSGSIMLRQAGGSTLKSFSSDFGSEIRHQFTITGVAAIAEQINGFSVQVYPNPASDLLNVELSLQHPAEVTLNILDATGRYVSTSKLPPNGRKVNERIDLQALQNGIYLLQISDGKHTYTERIIKQR